MTMHTNQQWTFQKTNINAYDNDGDIAGVENDENFNDFGVGDLTATGRRYLTIQPKQWSTSYVANRQHYVSNFYQLL